MRIRKNIGGYSVAIAEKYVDLNEKLVLLTTDPQKNVEWVNNKPTDKINGYSYWFIENNGAEPFKIKFKDKLEKVEFLENVQVQDLVACEVEKNVYFKAKSILK